MATYIDDRYTEFGRRPMCRLIADNDAELHALAQVIGVAREWFRGPPAHEPHYDVDDTLRADAVDSGAIPITWKELACMTMRRRATGELGLPAEAEQWAADHIAKARAGG